MATAQWITAWCLVCLLPICLGFGFFDDILGDTESCQDVCRNTYPLHTYEKALHLSYCERGCRLFTIIDFVNEDENLNATRDSCVYSCREAYNVKEDANACISGCDCQVNIIETRRQRTKQMLGMSRLRDQMVEVDQQMNPLYPFLYVHNWYSNMVDKLSQQMSVSWSFYVQGDNGKMVIVKSEPSFFSSTGQDDEDEDYKTSNYIESNLAILDNSATPNLKHSQMNAIDPDLPQLSMKEDMSNDWLGCIAKKTGLPRLLLSFTIFMSAIVMIWLCFTTAATAPDQRVPAQKLSIYGDLDYLKMLDDKSLLASIHPQDKVEAQPLPIKVKVQSI